MAIATPIVKGRYENKFVDALTDVLVCKLCIYLYPNLMGTIIVFFEQCLPIIYFVIMKTLQLSDQAERQESPYDVY